MYKIPDYAGYQRPRSTWRQALVFLTAPVARVFRDFCLFTSMHGFNHIAWPRRHWFERLLWALVTAGAIWGAVDISLGQWQRFNDNPTVVTLEKDFRTWRFSQPAFTACDEGSIEILLDNRVSPTKLPAVIKSFWNITPDHEKYEYYSKFVQTVANSDLLRLSGYQEFKDDQSLNVDLLQLTTQVVPDINLKTSWSEDVDSSWTLVMTEAGACYTTNSLAIGDIAIVKPNPNETKMYPITCKYATMSCFVIQEVFTNTIFYYHSPYDIMDITVPPSTIVLTLNRQIVVSVMETRCGKGVEGLSPTRRACRYTAEPEGGSRRVFSTNSCRLTCRSKLSIKLCGCKPFYYFYEEGETCTPAGMACLSAYPHLLANNAGDRCACAQQCVDAIFKEISYEDQYWAKGPFMHRGALRLTIQAPRTRYTREIVFHFQDLVVSFGGAAGLFIGASFISFVEIFYFILERTCTVCVPEEPAKKEDMKIKQQSLPFETVRMKQLSAILKAQRRYDHGRHMKLYY